MAHTNPTPTVSAELVARAQALVASGRFASVEAVLQAGVDALERQNAENELREAIRIAVERPEISDVDGNAAFTRLRTRYGLPSFRAAT